MPPSAPKSYKKTRLQVGRQISSKQPSASAGPSTSAPPSSRPSSSSASLPPSIDVDKFAIARSFEIQSMKSSMKSAFESSTKRAFQTLPRHLRRRAASHNPRRVPGRLRAKAASEIDPKTSAIKKHYPKKKVSRKTGLSRTQKLRRRQRSKIWLETHIWMAKRMHMVNTWGFRLAHRPTEKAFRPSHRAAVHGSILSDVSYFSLLELKGEEEVLERILKKVAGEICWGKRFSSGARQAQTTLHLPDSYPRSLLCPATILWCPLPAASGSSSAPAPIRQVWVRFHPASHAETFGALRLAITRSLEEIKVARIAEDEQGSGKGKRRGRPECFVELNDIRESVCAFEIVGPKSARVLRGALGDLVRAEEREDVLQIWDSFGSLQTSGSLPRNMAIGLQVYDPRLAFPPCDAKPRPSLSDSSRKSAWEVEPSPSIASSELWNEESRLSAGEGMVKKSVLDERRRQVGIPGTRLRALATDSRLPLILLQHTLAPRSTPSSSTSLHGFLLLLPAAWGQTFLSSLVFTGTRVAGLRERRSQGFEAGVGAFPEDWAGTRACSRWWRGQADEEIARWARKPKGKRVKWGSVGWADGVGDPWAPDWKALLSASVSSAALDEDEEMETNDEPKADVEPIDPWLLHSSDLASVLLPSLLTSAEPAQTFINHLNVLRAKRSLLALPLSSAQDLYRTALVRVSVKLLGRGLGSDVGPIYALSPASLFSGDGPNPENEEARWRRAFAGGKDGSDLDRDEEASATLPPQSLIIGYQTTARLSLSRGKGHGLGAMPLLLLVALFKKDVQEGRAVALVGKGVLPASSGKGQLLGLVRTRGREGRLARPAVVSVTA